MRYMLTAGMIGHVLERALIFLRLRLSLRERFFFHLSLILQMWGEYMQVYRNRGRTCLSVEVAEEKETGVRVFGGLGGAV